MSKNLNKVRDMRHAKYYRMILGDEVSLRRIILMYEDYCVGIFDKSSASIEPYMRPDEMILKLNIDMDSWRNLVDSLNLELIKDYRRKMLWRIA